MIYCSRYCPCPEQRVSYVTQFKALLPVTRCEISPSYHFGAEPFSYDSPVGPKFLLHPPPPPSLALASHSPLCHSPSTLPPILVSVTLSPSPPSPSPIPFLYPPPSFSPPIPPSLPLTLSSSLPPSFSSLPPFLPSLSFLHVYFHHPMFPPPSSYFLTRGLFHTMSYLLVPLRNNDWELGGNSGSVNNSPLC